MTLSVLMAVHNGGKTVYKAIESILAQSMKEFEFLIVNDNSTDNTVEIIQSFKDSRIKIVNNKFNIGQTKSLNVGLGLCTGDIVARMDADDISFPFRFEKQMKVFRDNPSVVLVGSRGEGFGISGNRKRAPYFPLRLEEIYLMSLYRSPLNHVSVMFNRRSVIDLGGYREDFLISADFDLWSKMLRNRMLIHVLNETCVKYFIGDSTYSKKNIEAIKQDNSIITMENIYLFCKISINELQSKSLFELHESEKQNLNNIWMDFILWQKILNEYSFAKNYFYWRFRIIDTINILVKILIYWLNKLSFNNTK